MRDVELGYPLCQLQLDRGRYYSLLPFPSLTFMPLSPHQHHTSPSPPLFLHLLLCSPKHHTSPSPPLFLHLLLCSPKVSTDTAGIALLESGPSLFRLFPLLLQSLLVLEQGYEVLCLLTHCKRHTRNHISTNIHAITAWQLTKPCTHSVHHTYCMYGYRVLGWRVGGGVCTCLDYVHTWELAIAVTMLQTPTVLPPPYHCCPGTSLPSLSRN